MKKYIFLFALLFLPITSMQAAYLLKDGKLIDTKDIADKPLQEHFDLGMAALQKKNWEEAVRQFRIVTISFPDADLAKEAHYFLGVAYYHFGDADLANKNLTQYISSKQNPKYFIEAYRYKLAIADAFKDGARKHLFNQEKLPKLFGSQKLATEIYDEIVQALPHHDIAAKALFSKAELLRKDYDFKTAVDTYQSLIRKFPKTTLAAQSFIKISETLLEQSKLEFQNPDLLSQQEIHYKKFERTFPKAKKQLAKAKACLIEMQEVYAEGLYETGQLYERKSLPKASVLYYFQTIKQFPETKVAEKCKGRLQKLDKYVKELELKTDVS